MILCNLLKINASDNFWLLENFSISFLILMENSESATQSKISKKIKSKYFRMLQDFAVTWLIFKCLALPTVIFLCMAVKIIAFISIQLS